VLVDTACFERDQGLHVLRAFKTHADLDPATAGFPKVGRAEFTVGARTIAVRVATMPTVSGEKLALRLLKPVLARLGIEELGLSPPNFKVPFGGHPRCAWNDSGQRPHGVGQNYHGLCLVA
jgi:type II secretory ATPase GspE/PulE/Tfp pilus assembly ATPase PilB-like protein